MICVAADHIEQQSQARPHRCVFECVSAGRTDRPGQNVAMSETTDLEDRLYVVVESVRFAKPPRAEGLALLVPSTTGIDGVIVPEPQVIEISGEGKQRTERRSRAIDAPEKLAGELIIELILLLPRRFRHEGIDLPASTTPNKL